jgi:hypothetical protein
MTNALMLTLALLGSPAFAATQTDVLGVWQYDGFFYQNHRYPNPNPELKLTFTFLDDKTAQLYWKRDNEDGFCERKGTFEVQNDVLKQTVTWLNPANDASCAKDPDMQMPRTTENKFAVDKGELSLHMDLDGKDFIYILKKLP